MSKRELFLVSGGSGGIGSAVCVELAERGFTPIIGYYRNQTAAETMARQTGGIALALDMNSRESISAACATLAAMDQKLAGVVLAGSPPPDLKPFGQISAEEMIQQWQVNVLGPQQLLAELVRHCFRKNKSGCVVGILTSAMGSGIGSTAANMSSYVTAKYGMLGLLSALAADYPWLRVRSVSPGYTDTPMLATFDERFLEMKRAQNAISTPKEIAVNIIVEALGNGS